METISVAEADLFDRSQSFCDHNDTPGTLHSIAPRTAVSVDSCITPVKKMKKRRKSAGNQRQLSVGDPIIVMSPLSFEDIDVLNTPLSSLRSCSEYQRANSNRGEKESNLAPAKQDSSWYSILGWMYKSSKKKRVTISESVSTDEQKYILEQFQYNEANLTPEEQAEILLQRNSKANSKLSSIPEHYAATATTTSTTTTTPTLTGRNSNDEHPPTCFGRLTSIDTTPERTRRRDATRHNLSTTTGRNKSVTESIYRESATALDMFFGFNVQNNRDRNTADCKSSKIKPVKEIELQTFKPPEVIYSFSPNTSNDAVAEIEHEIGDHRRSGFRRVTSLRTLQRLGRDESLVDIDVSTLLQPLAPAIAVEPVTMRQYLQLEWWQHYFQHDYQLVLTTIRALMIDPDDSVFYESIRIQPFASGSYLRASLVAGFFNLWFGLYNLVCWLTDNAIDNTTVQLLRQTSHIAMVFIYVEKALFAMLIVQILVNLLQMPIRLFVHYQCWESSRAVETETAVNLLRGLVVSEYWLFNRFFAKIVDSISILSLVLCEVYLLLSRSMVAEVDSSVVTLAMRAMIVSISATNLLTLIVRLIVAGAFVLSMHDPAVLSDARRRGLSKWDLEVLPTFVFASFDEVTNKECCICLGAFDIGEMLISLPCDNKHSFHASCIRQWLQRQNSCPLCQKMV